MTTAEQAREYRRRKGDAYRKYIREYRRRWKLKNPDAYHAQMLRRQAKREAAKTIRCERCNNKFYRKYSNQKFCSVCGSVRMKVYMREWRERNKQHVRDYERSYAPRLKELRRKRYAENRTVIREKQRAWRRQRAALVNETQRKWRAKNKDYVRELNRMMAFGPRRPKILATKREYQRKQRQLARIGAEFLRQTGGML